jgi:hypothetical protein
MAYSCDWLGSMAVGVGSDAAIVFLKKLSITCWNLGYEVRCLNRSGQHPLDNKPHGVIVLVPLKDVFFHTVTVCFKRCGNLLVSLKLGSKQPHDPIPIEFPLQSTQVQPAEHYTRP